MRIFSGFVARLASTIATRVAGIVGFLIEKTFHQILRAIQTQGEYAVTSYDSAKASLDKLVADIDVLKTDRQAAIDAAVAAGVSAATADRDAQIAALTSQLADAQTEFASLQAEADAADAGIAPAPVETPAPVDNTVTPADGVGDAPADAPAAA